MNTVQIGDIGETIAIYLFTKHNCIVSKPLTNTARYDLIIEKNNKLYKIQVKTTEHVKEDKMIFSIKSTNYLKGTWHNENYTTDEVDIFFLYCIENNWCGLYIPENQGEIQKELWIRITPPKNNQKIGIRMMNDYYFEKQFALLA